MKKKQILGIVVAGVVFVFVCSMSILMNSWSSKKANSLEQVTSMLEGVDYKLPSTSFIGVVKVEGTIMDSSTSSLFDTAAYNHKKTLDLVDKLKESKSNKGILLYVDSPGGGVYESDELYLKLKEYKEETGRPIWTYMGSMACSGGYYISMASDKIYANRNTWTGSIGVIISMSNYKDLMDKVGIKTVLFTSGANKSMGNSGVEITEEQTKIFQSLVDESYEQFVGIVSEGRNMSVDTVKPIADGRIYTAKQALDKNLIDGIQSYDETVEQFKASIGKNVSLYTPENSNSYWKSLLSSAKSQLPKSDMEVIKEFLKTDGSGVPMYYANTGE